jgi:hypothetical protein
MPAVVSKNHLQSLTYKYSWTCTDTDGKYLGPLDREIVNKSEGYEVAEFIAEIVNKHNFKTVKDVHKIEDALHADELRLVVLRDQLTAEIECKLKL